jgi:hypothetical protein
MVSWTDRSAPMKLRPCARRVASLQASNLHGAMPSSREGDALQLTRRQQHRRPPTARADMFPTDAGKLARADEQPSGERYGRLAVPPSPRQRGTLYDSLELNAMVARLNSGEARRPRRAAGNWLAAPKALFRTICKGAFLGARPHQ